MQLQIRLLTILAAVTYLCVVFAVLRVYGFSSIVGFCGILTAFVVHRNRGVVRNEFAKSGLAWGAWGLFITSMFLPCMEGTVSFFGYEAAFAVLEAPLRLASESKLLTRDGASVVLIDLANIMLTITPPLLLLSRCMKCDEQVEYVVALMISATSPAVWTVVLRLSPSVGYYCWAFSFVILVSAIRMEASHVVIMCFMFALMCLTS